MIKSDGDISDGTFDFEFAGMFAEDMYTYRFDENQMNTI